MGFIGVLFLPAILSIIGKVISYVNGGLIGTNIIDVPKLMTSFMVIVPSLDLTPFLVVQVYSMGYSITTIWSRYRFSSG